MAPHLAIGPSLTQALSGRKIFFASHGSLLSQRQQRVKEKRFLIQRCLFTIVNDSETALKKYIKDKYLTFDFLSRIKKTL
jgi:hypothetical protein